MGDGLRKILEAEVDSLIEAAKLYDARRGWRRPMVIGGRMFVLVDRTKDGPKLLEQWFAIGCYDHDRRKAGDRLWCGYLAGNPTLRIEWIEEAGELPEDLVLAQDGEAHRLAVVFRQLVEASDETNA
jgi:hypothetical protein